MFHISRLCVAVPLSKSYGSRNLLRAQGQRKFGHYNSWKQAPSFKLNFEARNSFFKVASFSTFLASLSSNSSSEQTRKHYSTTTNQQNNNNSSKEMAPNGEIPVHKVVIIGSGPAAHTAAIYTGRAQLEPVMFEGFMAGNVAAGGQLTMTTEIENFPGFPEGILGPELMERMRKQSVHCGATIFTETVEEVDLKNRPFTIKTSDRVVKADSVIISTGATAKRMEIPGTGEHEFWNRGVSACAVCDGAAPIFRNKPLAVIGGGDSAMEEANFLTRYGSKVYVIHRRDDLRASKVMQDRAKNNPKIEFLFSHVVTKATGDKLLTALEVEDCKTKAKRTIPVNGLFFAIGHEPNTKFLNGQLPVDDQGYLITEKGSTRTSIEGVYAAGDCQDKKYRQAITAAGSGCMAALECEHYLASLSK